MTDTIHPFKVGYGYGSNRDNQVIKFDLCESCLEELYSSFVVPAEVKDYWA
jgi:hypothetical protein